MSDNINPVNPKTDPDAALRSNTRKDPEDWVTGDEPMTGAQASYLRTLCEEAKEDFDPNLNKADASRRIDELRRKTGKPDHKTARENHDEKTGDRRHRAGE
jgi:hypothetical protein